MTAQDVQKGAQPKSLYAAHEKIYPQRVFGRFRMIKWVALCVLLGLYYLAPWLRWNRGAGVPDQALLIDLPGRRAYFFWIEIWPQEVYYLAGLLMLGAFGLFLATALLGRVWCGFTCPQTVWTDLFLWVERWIEGDRNKRMKLDKEPMSVRKIGLKLAKHGVWLLIALLTGGAWAMYFDDAPTLLRNFVTLSATPTQYGFIALFTATTYLLAGWAREQVCIYMCPWPRFQSAMFDERTMLVTYEEWRGEPRGKAKAIAADGSKLGDCVDCGLCHHVCPTGVDIRNGQQLACIGCGLCIDACNGIMEKVGRPLDLITYDSIYNQVQRSAGQPTQHRFVRARTVFYAIVITLIGAAMVLSLSLRSRLDVSLQADRSPLFVRLKNGDIQNGYSIKILNMIRQPGDYSITVTGIDGLRIKVIGDDDNIVTVPGDTVGTFRLLLHAAAKDLHDESTPIHVMIEDQTTHETSSHDAIFRGPAK
ncbi:cytochrome c oxidase accessory protein CcoG [Dongia sp.]|uniref:cytochrome c oxidase accessory protein CcoG n=1 Tax=Dongia sp. TaxID=1977262 RepID=UPI0035AE83C9